MAQNLLIGPQVVPIRGQPAKVPLESPQLAQAKEATSHLDTMMSHLLRSAVTMEASNTGVDAYVYYKDHLAKLDEDVDKIPKLEDRMPAFDKGLEKIKADLRKDYPTLPPPALKSIELEMIGDRRETSIKTTNAITAEAERHYKRLLEDLSKRSIKSTSDAERISIASNAHKLIEDAAKNGYIHPDEVDHEKYLFDYNIEKERLTALGMKDPKAVLGLTPDNVKVNPTDLGVVQDRARAQLNRDADTATAAFKQKKNDVMKFLNTHPEFADAPEFRAYTTPDFRNNLIPPIPNEQAKSVVAHIHGLDDVHQLEKYYEDISALKTTPEQKTAIDRAYSDAHRNLTSSYHSYIRTKQIALDHEIEQKRPPIIPGLPDFDKQWINDFKLNIKNFPDQVKDKAAADKLFNDYIKQIDEHFAPPPTEKKPEVPLPKGAIPAEKGKVVPATRPTTTPTEAPTPKATPEPTPEGVPALPPDLSTGTEGTPPAAVGTPG